MRLEGRTAFVTGGASGIGAATAQRLASEGAQVVIADIDGADKVAADLGGEAVETDVTDVASVRAAVSAAQRAVGPIDILVNNAGTDRFAFFVDTNEETWDHVLAVNLRGPFLCTRAAMRLMKPQGGGRILNIASISAQRVRPHSAPYSTSKHGLWGLTQVTALEGRDHGIICSCLHPGNVLNERRAASGQPQDQEPMMQAEELAEVAVLMATLPPHINMLEAIVLPVEQLYIGRG
jgi:NAD(P)-dependent dehydrogenase (short-subunit alcohol dehydrogenase family)